MMGLLVQPPTGHRIGICLSLYVYRGWCSIMFALSKMKQRDGGLMIITQLYDQGTNEQQLDNSNINKNKHVAERNQILNKSVVEMRKEILEKCSFMCERWGLIRMYNSSNTNRISIRNAIWLDK